MDRDLSRQMAAFEAARIAHPLHLEPTPIQRILAVHDGTARDVTDMDVVECFVAQHGFGDIEQPLETLVGARLTRRPDPVEIASSFDRAAHAARSPRAAEGSSAVGSQ